MTRLLVTGATTPIGRALIGRLLEDRTTEHVVGVGAEPTFPGRPNLDPARWTYASVDLTRPRGVRALLFGEVKRLSVDTIVHTAFHRRASARGARAHALNVGATRTLLDLASRHPTITQFVHQSAASVYRIDNRRPVFLDENQPLELRSSAPQFVRDRVEGDVTVCTRMGLSPLRIRVLRCAEILARDCGSQLYDYLRSKVCFRPAGFDPMLNLLSVEDAVRALILAIQTREDGVFNIPGADTLPLSTAIEKSARLGIAIPGPTLSPLYGLRALLLRTDFDYGVNQHRFHFSGVVDGARAKAALGYQPERALHWPNANDEERTANGNQGGTVQERSTANGRSEDEHRQPSAESGGVEW